MKPSVLTTDNPEVSKPINPPSVTKIAIVGLGYVGLPLSLQFARRGVEVLGLDIDSAKVAALNAGRSYGWMWA